MPVHGRSTIFRSQSLRPPLAPAATTGRAVVVPGVGVVYEEGTDQVVLEGGGVLHQEQIATGITTLTPSGIASAEAFGAGQVNPALSVGSIASAEAFGSHTVGSGITLTPSAIGSAEAFGTALVNPALQPTAIASLEAFGATVVDVVITPGSIVSAEAFGTTTIDVILIASALASAEAFGSHTVTAGGVVAPTGIASAEAFGAALLNPSLAASAVPSGETFGTSQLDPSLTPGGIVSTEAFGAANVVIVLTPSSIASAEAFGASVLSPTITPAGIISAEAFGAATIPAAQPITFVTLDLEIQPRVSMDLNLEPRVSLDLDIEPRVSLELVLNDGGKMLFLDNDNLITLNNVKDNVDDSLFTIAASITAKLETTAVPPVEVIPATPVSHVTDGKFQLTWDQGLLGGQKEGRYRLIIIGAEAGKDFGVQKIVPVGYRANP